MRETPRWLFVCTVAITTAQCIDNTPPDDPLTNSESHWLQACTTDEECNNKGSCICNVCSAPCRPEITCPDVDNAVTAICTENGARPLVQQCANAPDASPICLAACELDTDCPTPNSRCIGGACVNPLGCQDDVFWGLSPNTFSFEGGDVPHRLEFIERGDPGDISVRLCTEGGEPLVGPSKLIVIGLGPWDGFALHDSPEVPLQLTDPCTQWVGVPDLTPPIEPGQILDGYALHINPAQCDANYGFGCEPLVDNPCGTCGFTLWSIARGCRP